MELTVFLIENFVNLREDISAHYIAAFCLYHSNLFLPDLTCPCTLSPYFQEHYYSLSRKTPS